MGGAGVKNQTRTIDEYIRTFRRYSKYFKGNQEDNTTRVPEAEETMSYNIPAFNLNENT
jgi:uncharacterized protein YdhG (YjbR/CyaY superfamily)